jgi:hypothetical protein
VNKQFRAIRTATSVILSQCNLRSPRSFSVTVPFAAAELSFRFADYVVIQRAKNRECRCHIRTTSLKWRRYLSWLGSFSLRFFRSFIFALKKESLPFCTLPIGVLLFPVTFPVHGIHLTLSNLYLSESHLNVLFLKQSFWILIISGGHMILKSISLHLSVEFYLRTNRFITVPGMRFNNKNVARAESDPFIARVNKISM